MTQNNKNIRKMDSILDKHIRTLLLAALVALIGTPGFASDLDRQVRFQLLHQVQIWDPVKPIDPAPVFEAGVVLVQFAEGTDLAAAERLVAKGNYEIGTVNLFASMRLLVVKVAEGSEEEAIRFFRSSRAVSHAERSAIVGIMG